MQGRVRGGLRTVFDRQLQRRDVPNGRGRLHQLGCQHELRLPPDLRRQGRGVRLQLQSVGVHENGQCLSRRANGSHLRDGRERLPLRCLYDSLSVPAKLLGKCAQRYVRTHVRQQLHSG